MIDDVVAENRNIRETEVKGMLNECLASAGEVERKINDCVFDSVLAGSEKEKLRACILDSDFSKKEEDKCVDRVDVSPSLINETDRLFECMKDANRRSERETCYEEFNVSYKEGMEFEDCFDSASQLYLIYQCSREVVFDDFYTGSHSASRQEDDLVGCLKSAEENQTKQDICYKNAFLRYNEAVAVDECIDSNIDWNATSSSLIKSELRDCVSDVEWIVS